MSSWDVEAPQLLLSFGLDAEHKEDAHFDELVHLETRPGPSLVPDESSNSSSPAVSESRRAFKRAFLSVGGSSTSDALSFPWLLAGTGIAAGGLPFPYGAFVACTAMAASHSFPAD